MPQRFGTRAIHAGQQPDPSTGAVMTPIYATSTYVQKSPGVHQGFEYSRSQNPTRFAYERCVADLEGGSRGFAFASGLAAISTVLELLDSGSHVVASDDLYGGTFRLFRRVRQRSAGLQFTFIDMSDPAAIEAALQPNTRMLWVETPSNPMMKLVDLTAIASIARRHSIAAVADNTFATPFLQQPLENGFDIVVHSATKYLNGHSDVIGGIAVVRDADWATGSPSCKTRLVRSPGPSMPFWCCAVSRRCTFAWNGTVQMAWQSRSTWRNTRAWSGCSTPGSPLILSTHWRAGRCAHLAA